MKRKLLTFLTCMFATLISWLPQAEASCAGSIMPAVLHEEIHALGANQQNILMLSETLLEQSQGVNHVQNFVVQQSAQCPHASWPSTFSTQDPTFDHQCAHNVAAGLNALNADLVQYAGTNPAVIALQKDIEKTFMSYLGVYGACLFSTQDVDTNQIVIVLADGTTQHIDTPSADTWIEENFGPVVGEPPPWMNGFWVWVFIAVLFGLYALYQKWTFLHNFVTFFVQLLYLPLGLLTRHMTSSQMGVKGIHR